MTRPTQTSQLCPQRRGPYHYPLHWVKRFQNSGYQVPLHSKKLTPKLPNFTLYATWSCMVANTFSEHVDEYVYLALGMRTPSRKIRRTLKAEEIQPYSCATVVWTAKASLRGLETESSRTNTYLSCSANVGCSRDSLSSCAFGVGGTWAPKIARECWYGRDIPFNPHFVPGSMIFPLAFSLTLQGRLKCLSCALHDHPFARPTQPVIDTQVFTSMRHSDTMPHTLCQSYETPSRPHMGNQKKAPTAAFAVVVVVVVLVLAPRIGTFTHVTASERNARSKPCAATGPPRHNADPLHPLVIPAGAFDQHHCDRGPEAPKKMYPRRRETVSF